MQGREFGGTKRRRLGHEMFTQEFLVLDHARVRAAGKSPRPCAIIPEARRARPADRRQKSDARRLPLSAGRSLEDFTLFIIGRRRHRIEGRKIKRIDVGEIARPDLCASAFGIAGKLAPDFLPAVAETKPAGRAQSSDGAATMIGRRGRLCHFFKDSSSRGSFCERRHRRKCGPRRAELADRAFHLELDQALQLDAVFHRELADEIVHESVHAQAHGLRFGQAALLHVKDLLGADLATLASCCTELPVPRTVIAG